MIAKLQPRQWLRIWSINLVELQREKIEIYVNNAPPQVI